MEDSFGINNVTLVDGQPQTLGLVELLSVYVGHRIDVVRRRTAFRLGKKKDRLHLVEGLLIAIVDIDEVIQIIRSSDEAAAARVRLMSIYDLSEIQANYILELRLRQLTKYSRIELEKEQDELRREIAELEAILGSEERLRELVSGELAEIAEKYGTPRRTVLLESEAVSPTVAAELAASNGKGKAAPLALEIPDDPCWAILTASGQIARTSNQEPLAESGPRSRHDVFRSVLKTTARGEIAAVTSQGRMLRLQVMDMPMLPPMSGLPNLAGGVQAKDFITLLKGESLVAFAPLDQVLAIGTAQGVVKRVQPDYPLNREDWEVIALKDKDSVVGVAAAGAEDTELVFLTRQAQLLRFAAGNVRPQGRTAGGMTGIKLSATSSPADSLIPVMPVTRWCSSTPFRRRTPPPLWSPLPVRTVHCPGPLPAPRKSRRSPNTRRRAVPRQGSAPTGSSRARTPCCWPGPGMVRRRRHRSPALHGPCRRSTAGATGPVFRCPSPWM
jgi:DNA gyrase subunit A